MSYPWDSLGGDDNRDMTPDEEEALSKLVDEVTEHLTNESLPVAGRMAFAYSAIAQLMAHFMGDVPVWLVHYSAASAAMLGDAILNGGMTEAELEKLPPALRDVLPPELVDIARENSEEMEEPAQPSPQDDLRGMLKNVIRPTDDK